MRIEQQSYQLTIAQDQTKHQPKTQTKPVRHIYLEEENIYGRFVPYLLLKDQLESEVDSSGNTALHHMCSHNSPYIPLFLNSIPNGDPILNKKSKLNHAPLDVAGLYCSKQYVQMLKAKGAIDYGNVDFWAIQGANYANWSEKVYADKKVLIHWAAYNDLPEVIAQYAKQGINVSDQDSNGLSPVDLTVLNKSYNSLRVLTELGERPKPELIKSTDSQSIKQHFKYLNQGASKKLFKKVLKTITLILFLVLCLFINLQKNTIATSVSVLVIVVYIMVIPIKVERYIDNNRKTQFVSELLLNKVINRSNHFSYLLLHLAIILCGIYSIYQVQISNHLQALVTLIIAVYVGVYSIHFCIQVFGICKNLTYDQMFYSHRWSHLWDKIKYIDERKILIRHHYNPDDKGIYHNIKDYVCY